MKINGKYLAWTIIHGFFFMYVWNSDIWNYIKTTSTGDATITFIFSISLLFFLAWRFIENMDYTFKDKEKK